MTGAEIVTVINAGTIGYNSSRVTPRIAVAGPSPVSYLVLTSGYASRLVSAFASGIRGATSPPTGWGATSWTRTGGHIAKAF